VQRALAFVYRLAVGALLGAQLFFAGVGAPAAFTKAVAALPQGDPARSAAADLVGRQLGALDRIALSFTALAVLSAVLLARAGVQRARRSALPPLLAGLCAAASCTLITPAIQALRAQGQTATPLFGRLHALSSTLLLLEMLLLALALWRAPAARTE
jgi:hypothetical protein